MNDAASLLPADTGRPDTTEFSRVLVRHLLDLAGKDSAGLGAPTMQPTYRTTATTRSAAELVPGDIAELRHTSLELTALAEREPSVSPLAQPSATAHLTLANALEELRAHAEEIYHRADELGVGDELLSGSNVLRDQIDAAPGNSAELVSLAERGAALRMAWDEAQIDFVENQDAVREAFGIPRW